MVEMAAYAGLGDNTEEYLSLVRAFPLIHIRDGAHLTAALAVFEPLFMKVGQSVAEEAYLAVLTDLIEAYEDATVHFPPVSGVRIVRHFMEERGLNQEDLVGPVFATRSVASEVLTGNRPLTLTHIKALAAFFHLESAMFTD
jgi:HTH-type transcriptional regulator/antitoxin HigA